MPNATLVAMHLAVWIKNNGLRGRPIHQAKGAFIVLHPPHSTGPRMVWSPISKAVSPPSMTAWAAAWPLWSQIWRSCQKVIGAQSLSILSTALGDPKLGVSCFAQAREIIARVIA